jgi:hypothetical protein
MAGWAKGIAVGIAAGALIASTVGAAGAASAPPASGTAPTIVSADGTHDPTIGHAYRHGVQRRRAALHALTAGVSTAHDLTFGGGTTAPGYPQPVGVTTGTPRVYLVYWGTQWGTASTDTNGFATFSGDAHGIAPVQQAFFSGLGTAGETWSGVMTQYCDNAAVASVSCNGSTARVAYPTGGALAGVWEDTARAAPAAATGHQLALEAIAAAGHFGNTDGTANRDAQYVIVSPTGTDPDGWTDPVTGFCAWHDDTADSALSGGAASSPYGALAFTNMPYLPDVGSDCGSGFVNTPGIDDGVTLVGGHEYAETLTDQFPAGGWTDASGNENADKCAWIASGAGAAQNITLATGSFPVQSTWANDGSNGAGACETSHPIGVSVGPAFTSGTVATLTEKTAQSFTIKASGASTWAEVGALPAGVKFSPGSGIATLHGTATVTGKFPLTITAADPVASTSESFTLWVTPPRKFLSPAKATLPVNRNDTFTVVVQGNFASSTTGPPVLPALTETGPMPPGLTFTDNHHGTATISGQPTVRGTSSIVVAASASKTIRQTLKLVIA